MQRIRRFLGSFLVAAAMIVPAVSTGCAARARYYDAEYRDHHRWDAREDRVYGRYWDEGHERYRDWKERNERERGDYWKWQHDHRDRD
jgi:hypothetical protein